MTVIPFDPKRAAEGSPSREITLHGLTARVSMGARQPDQMALSEARARIDVLERALIATLKENAVNWARAERAETLLTHRAEFDD